MVLFDFARPEAKNGEAPPSRGAMDAEPFTLRRAALLIGPSRVKIVVSPEKAFACEPKGFYEEKWGWPPRRAI